MKRLRPAIFFLWIMLGLGMGIAFAADDSPNSQDSSGFEGVWSTLIGTIIGGVIAAKTSQRVIKKQFDNQEKKAKANLRAAVKCIEEEVTTLWALYKATIGVELDDTGKEPFKHYYNPAQEYFIVYQENASKIGMVEDKSWRTQAVTVHSKLKALADTYLLNNKFLEDLNRTNEQEAKKAIEGKMKKITRLLKDRHQDLESDIKKFSCATKRYLDGTCAC